MTIDPSDDVLPRIRAEHVDALAAGAVLLGSGGGGDVSVGRQLLRGLLRDRSIEMLPASVLAPDTLVVHVGVVGGPDVISERLVDPGDLALAAQAVVGHLGGRLGAVGVIEIGGLNGLMGVLAAARLGVPVVDGDLMGRAFPLIDQTTLAVAGHPMTPMALVSPAGDTVLVATGSARTTQALLTSTAVAMGGAAAVALYPTTAAVLNQVGVHGSLSACLALGTAYLDPRAVDVRTMIDLLGGRLLFDGRVDEIRPRRGGELGCVTLGDPVTGATARVDHKDEFLAVSCDGATVTATPDVVVALDPSNHTPLRTDQLRVGQPLVVFALPPLHDWPAEAAPVVGLARFGLDLEVTR
ncbi:DUF917 domain-containing protein [Kribbella catacumbae]|uniref:DUF917 domain-containing protein n=1 Tax=Kribbella catacumbae TaxID=460086 RepID=UPI00037A495B|nr:DUF917 domain-containing protein [Kribbella catacumbae]